MNPKKNPEELPSRPLSRDARKGRWQRIELERERKVRRFVETSPLPPSFSRLQRETRIPKKQLARSLRSLAQRGFYPTLRWVDLAVRGRVAPTSATARDIGSVRLPPGSGGRSWAIDFLCLLRDGRLSVKSLSPLAVRRYRQLEREGAVRFRTDKVRTGRRGRPCHVVYVELAVNGDSHG